jgi:hypothetical protein
MVSIQSRVTDNVEQDVHVWKVTFFTPWKNESTLSLLPVGEGGIGGVLCQKAIRVTRNEAMAGIA